jgi:hypothetical protein
VYNHLAISGKKPIPRDLVEDKKREVKKEVIN